MNGLDTLQQKKGPYDLSFHSSRTSERLTNKEGILVTKDTASPESAVREQQLRNKLDPNERALLVKDYKTHLERLTPPGIAPIKQWELWHKWRPFVPLQFQDVLCPKPSAEVFDIMKKSNKDKSAKAAEVRASKKRRKQGDQVDLNAMEPSQPTPEADSTQNPTNQPQRDTVPDQMTLDSIRQELNPDPLP